MAKVHVCNVVVLDNPSHFNNPFQFEITFECIEDLPEDLEWKIIYVGSAESEEFDQVLDTGKPPYQPPTQVMNKLISWYFSVRGSSSRGKAHVRISGIVKSWRWFNFGESMKANPPNPEKIPEADLVGVTVVLLTCSYRSAGWSRNYGSSFIIHESLFRIHSDWLLCEQRLHWSRIERKQPFTPTMGQTSEKHLGNKSKVMLE